MAGGWEKFRELKDLSYAEELLIARYQQNYCVTHVKGGQKCLRANMILFEQPVAKVYDVLPPPQKKMENCLAILFSGTAKPCEDNYKCTPFLVRHHVVLRALRWLALNHELYDDMVISEDNLATYSETQPPVFVIRCEDVHGASHNLAVYEADDARDGDCPFLVCTISGPDLAQMDYKKWLTMALKYFEAGGHALSIGHME
ncbi:hypothetical protein C8Q76DRAFT_768500 [Earliella scabrosa]|nr:hypothetical protein C8Q76DRAFT_768500 [Earliella scabrosa]